MEFSLEHLQPKERASFALRSLYETAGCRKYHMGRFEEYSLYQENRSFLSSEQVITFTDLDGRLLALKPDVTLSIAKTAQPAPGETLRYYYHENVYRPSAESHTFKEISQMGLEMLGAVGEAEVQQAVCLAAQSLAALGAEWVLEVSHMGYLFGLFDALGVPEAARAQLLEKLRRLAEKYPDQIVKKDRQTFTVPKRCVSVREPYSAERRKAASERAKAAGYKPPVPKAGGK